jgi:hypothetical protein
MSKKRRTVWVLVRASVADHVSTADARKEIKTRVNEACCWKHEEEDVKITSASPMSRSSINEENYRRQRRKTNLAYLASY